MKAINENGTVKIMNRLPETWKNENGQDIINFRSSSDEDLEALNIFDVKLDPITEHQRYKNILIPSDFDDANSVWIMPIEDFTQQEIDEHEQGKLDRDSSAIKNEEYQTDGKREHKRFWDFVMRNYDDAVIDDDELEEISETLFSPTLPLSMGFWKISKSLVDAIPPSANGKVNFAINKVKNGIDQYILNNY